MDPILRRQLLSLAAGQRDRRLTSFSAIAVALIRRGLLADPEKPYGPTLEPVITGAITRNFTRHDNRLASLQARTAYEGAQTRHLVTNCLNFLITILNKLELLTDRELFQLILEQSEQKAREALTKRDPDIMEIIDGTHVGTGSEGKGRS